jgi:hypothetical protein
MMRQTLFTIFLWLSVINLSIWIGGTLFHMTVVLPIWSQHPPDSVRDFFGGTRAYEYLLDFYGPRWMAFRILPILIALWLGWSSKRHRHFVLVTVGTIVIGLVLSVLIVFPINEAIMARAGEGASPEEITRMVDTWILSDRARFALLSVGYFFLLRAFRLPAPSSTGTPASSS